MKNNYDRCEECGSKNIDKLLKLSCGCQFIFCKTLDCKSYMKIDIIHCQKHWDEYKNTIKNNPYDNAKLWEELNEDRK